jgi:hypothetical protein
VAILLGIATLEVSLAVADLSGGTVGVSSTTVTGSIDAVEVVSVSAITIDTAGRHADEVVPTNGAAKASVRRAECFHAHSAPRGAFRSERVVQAINIRVTANFVVFACSGKALEVEAAGSTLPTIAARPTAAIGTTLPPRAVRRATAAQVIRRHVRSRRRAVGYGDGFHVLRVWHRKVLHDKSVSSRSHVLHHGEIRRDARSCDFVGSAPQPAAKAHETITAKRNKRARTSPL